MIPIVGLGAGAHARAVIEAIRSVGVYDVVSVADDDTSVTGEIAGVPIVSYMLIDPDVPCAFVGVGGIEDAFPRKHSYRRLRGLGYDLPSIVHSSAIISPLAHLADGVQVLAGAIVNADAHIDEGAIINTGSIVEHDCLIGAHTHIAPGVTLGGFVVIGESSHVGLGSSILQEVRIGDNALIAAGSVVLHDVPDGTRVCGVPAKAMR